MNSMQAHKYQMLSKHSQEIIIFFNRSGNIIDFNNEAREVIGYGDQEKHLSVCEVFREAIKYENSRLMVQSKYLDKGSETVAYRRNNTCFPVHLEVSVEEGKKYIGLCTAVDISENKKIMRELKNFKNDIKTYKKNRKEFISNIAHELRTPINGMMGLTEELLKTDLSSEQAENLNIIYKCCINMNKIICDFLDYFKIAQHKLVLEQSQFEFRKCINGIATFHLPRMNEKGLNFIINVADDIPEFFIGDEFRLSQILTNLISNAIKFTDVGHVALEIVKTEQTDHDVELFFMVMDTGIGISREEQEKLFISFSQVDGSITRRFGGTGLGLSISKLLVEAMHGSIKVDSEKGKGSIFSFSVRLGIPENQEERKYREQKLFSNDGGFLKKEGCIRENNKPSNEVEDKGDILWKVTKNGNSKFDSPGNSGNIQKKLVDALKKLILSVEMENWESAEELALYIKNLIPENKSELRKTAFKILLMVRKENQDTSLMSINELNVRLSEENEWMM